MIVIIGASASGKTEVSKILQNKYGLNKCTTTTTRPIRNNEVDGIDYHFLSKKEFLDKIDNNEFVEYETYNDNYYGINRKDAINNYLVVVEPNGANTLINQLGSKIYVVYIETLYEHRNNRMLARGDNLDDIKKRLTNDEIVFKKENLNRIDLLVKNDYHDIEEVADYIYSNYKKHCLLKN